MNGISPDTPPPAARSHDQGERVRVEMPCLAIEKFPYAHLHVVSFDSP